MGGATVWGLQSAEAVHGKTVSIARIHIQSFRSNHAAGFALQPSLNLCFWFVWTRRCRKMCVLHMFAPRPTFQNAPCPEPNRGCKKQQPRNPAGKILETHRSAPERTGNAPETIFLFFCFFLASAAGLVSGTFPVRFRGAGFWFFCFFVFFGFRGRKRVSASVPGLAGELQKPEGFSLHIQKAKS